MTIWFIATVWIERDDDHPGFVGRPRVVLRLPAVDEADYRQQVRQYADDVYGKASHVTIGPISESKVQG